MATYRLEAKIIGRKQGRSATASAAYRAAERIEDARTGQSFDYTRKGGVLHKEILAPAGTPDWMRDRAQLWNAVEKAERRKDAQLARDLIISLPHELTNDQRRELVRDFIRSEFVARGMIADLAIHAPDRRGDDRNHHAHVMLTMRELTGSGFGNKERTWNETDLLEEWRAHWADQVNQTLERHGHAARVDHRSLADQGIDREPEPKQGPVATKMEQEGKRSHAGDDRRAAKARNDERADIAAELDLVSAEIVDLETERHRRADDPDRTSPLGEQQGGSEEMAEDDRAKRANPSVAMTDGGLVAQQREAMRRFEDNSKAMQAHQDQAPVPEASNNNNRPAEQPGREREDDKLRRFKDQMARNFGSTEREPEADRSDGDKSKGEDSKEVSDRERLRQFKAQMNRNFTRDDPGDRSR